MKTTAQHNQIIDKMATNAFWQRKQTSQRAIHNHNGL